MRQRKRGLFVLLLAASMAIVALTLALPAGAAKPQTINIESWLQAQPGSDLSSGVVYACAKVSGDVVNDTGGSPTWTSGDYGTVLPDLSAKCGDWTFVGGYRFEGRGHLQPQNFGELDNILFARHEIQLSQGSIFIQFTGRYFPSFLGEGRWVITGGTGAYQGLQGTGTWTASGQNFPYFQHTETGTVHWTGK